MKSAERDPMPEEQGPLKPLDILAISMIGLGAVAMLGGATGWIPSRLASVLAMGSFFGFFGGFAVILYRAGLPVKQIATGLGIIIGLVALIGIVSGLWVDYLWF